MKHRILITDFISEPLDIEREILGDLATISALNALSSEDLAEKLTDACVLMVYHFASVTRQMIESMPSLKMIVRCGAGYDNVDWRAAREHGIDVANVPDYGTEDVADSAIGLTLSIARGTHRLSHLCQRGTENWTYELVVPLRRIRGQIFGIIGCGRIGTATALRAKALGYDVVFFDPHVPDGKDKSIGVRREDTLEELVRQANVISCHCDLNQQTRHIINRQAIDWMQPGSILINTARGAVVDPAAVLYGLESGRLMGAGIDVLECEPPSDDESLIKAWRDPQHPAFDRLIITPHAAFYSQQGLEDMRRKGSINIRRMLTGQPLRNVIN
jgi:C-terminal binding protein